MARPTAAPGLIASASRKVNETIAEITVKSRRHYLDSLAQAAASGKTLARRRFENVRVRVSCSRAGKPQADSTWQRGPGPGRHFNLVTSKFRVAGRRRGCGLSLGCQLVTVLTE